VTLYHVFENHRQMAGVQGLEAGSDVTYSIGEAFWIFGGRETDTLVHMSI
jgi:hypothetical protein